MCHEERWGGRPDPKKSHIDAFQEMVYNCGLIDVGYVGNIFTWCNGQEGLSRMYQRLDRVLCNPFWRTSFAEAQVIHISTIHSDHKILLVQLHPKKSKLKRPFRFESMWTTDPTCKEVIKAAMQIEFDGSSSYAFCRNLTLCRRELLKWNQKEFGYLQTQMKEIDNQLKQLQEHNHDVYYAY
ncbi:hypothetical protein IFM89_026589 [Coptis chinensis]|uniref:Uncharacterized protein n=1 Tax=Coptis chinensis TaxID=261450 RepID=A0A835IQ30_9MAGN|nr:hypothetical protein IFM89_026589 [Coptis chinensis]